MTFQAGSDLTVKDLNCMVCLKQLSGLPGLRLEMNFSIKNLNDG